MIEIAKDFLCRCFAPGSTIAILLGSESQGKIQQRVVKLEQAATSRYLAWLAHENHNGANVYVAANPLRSGSRRRTKECIESVRHLYLDIDEDGDARLAAMQASNTVPPASAILSTSPGKYQVFWRVEGFDFSQHEIMLKRIASAFGGDPACTDCNRVLRIPGLLNNKYLPAYRVCVEFGSERIWCQGDFRLSDEPARTHLKSRSGIGKSWSRKRTRSEQDWAWVCHQLSAGEDQTEIASRLASRRSDKADPLYYAKRTVDVASACQLFFSGTSIDEVVSTLSLRRCNELPTEPSHARAKEIAATAQRMIERRNVA